MIEVQGLTKRYGTDVAVDDLTFEVRPGVVTGFLGPNGAGKSTTMRVIVGLDHPTAGQTRIDGRNYRTFDQPLRHVGALLETESAHPARSASSHLRLAAQSNGISRSRVDDLLEAVGLADVARRRVKTYSLGMRQRLGIAGALLGDPGVLLFDEPVNGLDAEGVRWIRHLVRDLASEGRTVLVSSHLMSEMQQIADRLVVIGAGKLIADAPVDELLARVGAQAIRVRTSDPVALARALHRVDAEVERLEDGTLLVSGVSTEEIGAAAGESGLNLYELTPLSRSLEQAYLQLTSASIGHAASTVDMEHSS